MTSDVPTGPPLPTAEHVHDGRCSVNCDPDARQRMLDDGLVEAKEVGLVTSSARLDLAKREAEELATENERLSGELADERRAARLAREAMNRADQHALELVDSLADARQALALVRSQRDALDRQLIVYSCGVPCGDGRCYCGGCACCDPVGRHLPAPPGRDQP